MRIGKASSVCYDFQSIHFIESLIDITGIKGIPDFVICGKVAPSKCYIVCSNNITEQQCTKAKQLCRNKTAHYITSSETELYVDFAASSTSGFTLTYDVTDCMETTQSTIEVFSVNYIPNRPTFNRVVEEAVSRNCE